MKETQYSRILDHLRKHKVATVRDLLRFTNYPSARLHEMTFGQYVYESQQWDGIGWQPTERITRTWVTRNGKRVRLYMLQKA